MIKILTKRGYDFKGLSWRLISKLPEYGVRIIIKSIKVLCVTIV